MVTGEAALRKPGDGAVCLSSGETLVSTSSGDVVTEMRGEGGVYRGAGVETVLPPSNDNSVFGLSGVVVVSPSADEGFKISSGEWGGSSISGV